MRKINHFLAIALLVLTIAAGCAPIYIPPAAQTPQFQQQGDFRGVVSSGINGLDLQVAYAPADGLGLLGAFSTSINSENNTHTYGELGIGGFLPNVDALVLAGYVGLGVGSAHGESTWYINNNMYEAEAQGNYLRPWIQANIGAHTQVIDGGVALRFANVAMRYTENNSPNPFPEKASHVFFEPVGYIGVGYDPVKLSMQVGLSTPLGDRLDFAYQPLIFSLCLSVDLNLLGSQDN